ncbi:lipocalin family protein [Hymenobacter sp. BRD67]|uniref:lipocalin family protein n=1 Tax=Hymenobacter sp. BRD67 TaxID=2675877 RepID=UPI0015672DC4|nr:lipocalin family protein [Hymenobacter sp. BRD67]QKG55058.1 hypothetical protein GKZ67_21785 [Hymenobacter sp. BRD67]
MKKTLACITLASLNSLFACHKNEDPQPPTTTQLLVGKKWQLQASTITALGQPPIDLYALSASYTKDDFEQFDLPNVFTYDEGPTKFSASSPQTQRGTWALSTDNTHLTITYNNHTADYIIDELTSTALKVHINQVQSNGATSVLTNSFVVIP